MKKSTKAKRAGKAGKPAKKDYELTYFLDHPQIQRHECVGNQEPKTTVMKYAGLNNFTDVQKERFTENQAKDNYKKSPAYEAAEKTGGNTKSEMYGSLTPVRISDGKPRN